MLDNLLDLVKQHSTDAIINNPAIPNERNDEAVAVASTSIFDGLKNAVGNGNLTDVLNMFTNGGNNAGTGLSQNIQSGFIDNLTSKFGLDKHAAGGIAESLIPSVLQNLVSKTNDPNDSNFNLQDIVSKIGGGNIDFQNILNNFTNNDSQSDTQKGGGIMDSLKGLFGG